MNELSDTVASILKIRLSRASVPISLVYLFFPCVLLWAKIKRIAQLPSLEGLFHLKHASRRISCKKAMTELGYRARPLMESIRDQLQHPDTRREPP